MQRVYDSIVKDVDELRERLISVWCELVNHAIDEWRLRGSLLKRETPTPTLRPWGNYSSIR